MSANLVDKIEGFFLIGLFMSPAIGYCIWCACYTLREEEAFNRRYGNNPQEEYLMPDKTDVHKDTSKKHIADYDLIIAAIFLVDIVFSIFIIIENVKNTHTLVLAAAVFCLFILHIPLYLIALSGREPT